MASKAFMALGLLVAVFLLVISSEVAARDVAKVVSKEDPAGVEDAKYGGYGGGHGGGGHGGYGGGGHGGGGHGGYGGGGHGGGGHGGYGGGGHGGGGHGGGHGCSYGCCYKSYGSCSKCCSYAGEVPEVETQEETHN